MRTENVYWFLYSVILAIVVFLTFAGCASYQKLEPGVFYKRDIGIVINGQDFEGVVAVPYAKKYDITVAPKGNLDLALIRSCHREFTAEKQDKKFLWFNVGKGRFRYVYEPVPGIEDARVCPVRIDVYESSKGRNSWAFLDFENPNWKVPAILTCNGEIMRVNGVGVCQSKTNLVQKIQFLEPVRIEVPQTECSKPVYRDGAYEIKTSTGECLYVFDTKDGRIGRLTVIGYQGVLVREAQ